MNQSVMLNRLLMADSVGVSDKKVDLGLKKSEGVNTFENLFKQKFEPKAQMNHQAKGAEKQVYEKSNHLADLKRQMEPTEFKSKMKEQVKNVVSSEKSNADPKANDIQKDPTTMIQNDSKLQKDDSIEKVDSNPSELEEIKVPENLTAEELMAYLNAMAEQLAKAPIEMSPEIKATLENLLSGAVKTIEADPNAEKMLETLQKLMANMGELKISKQDETQTGLSVFKDVLSQMQAVDHQKSAVPKELLEKLSQQVEQKMVSTQTSILAKPEMTAGSERNTSGGFENELAGQNAKLDSNALNSKQNEVTGEKGPFKEVIATKTNVKTTEGSDSKTGVVQNNVANASKLENGVISFNKHVSVNMEQKIELHKSIMDQVIQGAKMTLKPGENGSVMTLKLNPGSLGNVDVKLEIVKGVVVAEFNVQNQIVKGALEANLADLKNALSDKGYDVETLSVTVDQDGRNNRQEHQREQHAQKDGNHYYGDFDEEIKKASYDFETTVSDQGIDYLG